MNENLNGFNDLAIYGICQFTLLEFLFYYYHFKNSWFPYNLIKNTK